MFSPHMQFLVKFSPHKSAWIATKHILRQNMTRPILQQKKQNKFYIYVETFSTSDTCQRWRNFMGSLHYRWDIQSLSKERHIYNYPNHRVGTGWHIKCVGIWELYSSIAKNLIDNEDTKHTLFCRKIAFVAIYTIFSFIWWRLLKSLSHRMHPPLVVC